VDPERDPDKNYDVEITALSNEKLKVMGYAGTKFLSETMTWTRAPAGLKMCRSSATNAPNGRQRLARRPIKSAPLRLRLSCRKKQDQKAHPTRAT
jgi:hypothetical protein